MKLTCYLLAFALFILSCSSEKSEKKSTDELQSLIDKMSIEEKVGQMTQINIDVISVGEIYNLEEPHKLDIKKLENAISKYHIGSFLNVGGHAYDLAHWNEIMETILTYAVDSTDLGIPIVYGIDAIHGANYVMEGVLFPQQLAQAATFNPEMVKKAAEITAYETRAAGIPWNFSPVLDLGRQPLWSRFFETYGEDVFLAETMGDACVEGYQGGDTIDSYHVAACLKHFLGYSWSWTGKDRTPTYLPERQLREYYLPTFESAIKNGAKTIMINSGELNGIPVHANPDILIDLLRNELGFEGVALTDWEDIIKLVKIHKVAPTLKDAVKMAVMAGVDMSMTPNDYEFNDLLIELVNEGEVPMSRIDEAVYRVLKLKKDLGLFESPLSTRDIVYDKVGSEEHKQTSYDIACESITLLKNENNALPLTGTESVSVLGNAAHSKIMLNGAWSRTWQGVDPKYDDPEMLTIMDAFKANHEGSVVQNVLQIDSPELALEFHRPTSMNMSFIYDTWKRSEVMVYCLGELPSTEKPGDIDNLEYEFLDQIKRTCSEFVGKKKVLVLVENRPRIIREIEPFFDAIIMAYQPGQEGGRAIVDIIDGRVNPSGKLPFTYPKHPNTLLTYDHKYSETLDQSFGHNAFDPQYEFGDGLSYSDFVYSNLQISKDSLEMSGEVRITVDVKNNGIKGKESVLLFITDEAASITPSVKRLRGFEKIELDQNASQTVEFDISPKDLQFIGKEMDWVVEPGLFTISIDTLKQEFYLK